MPNQPMCGRSLLAPEAKGSFLDALDKNWFGDECIWADMLTRASTFLMPFWQRADPLLRTNNPAENRFLFFQSVICNNFLVK
jgi:hypothetical protein